MAEDDSQVGGCSLDDKLRLAANKGQVERIPTLLAQGAGFLPDKVSHIWAEFEILQVKTLIFGEQPPISQWTFWNSS